MEGKCKYLRGGGGGGGRDTSPGELIEVAR